MKHRNAIKLMTAAILVTRKAVLVQNLTPCSNVPKVLVSTRTKNAIICQTAKVSTDKNDKYTFPLCKKKSKIFLFRFPFQMLVTKSDVHIGIVRLKK